MGTDTNRVSGSDAPRYRDLEAWRTADKVAQVVYKETRHLMKEDRWLATQLRRAAFSAPANIAEGYGRASNHEFAHFLATAHGSLFEVDYGLYFTEAVDLVEAGAYDELLADCRRASRLVYGLMRSARGDAKIKADSRRYLKEPQEEYFAHGSE